MQSLCLASPLALGLENSLLPRSLAFGDVVLFLVLQIKNIQVDIAIECSQTK